MCYPWETKTFREGRASEELRALQSLFALHFSLFTPLRHPLARDALELDLLADFALELGVGAEDDLPTLDHLRGLEVGLGEHLLGVALALEGELEAADVLEHYDLSLVEGLDDVLLHALEHGVAVGGGHGGGVIDTLGELLHGELTGLLYGALEIVGIGVLGVATLGHGIGYWHRVRLV